ncbi:SET domain-containing protein [Pleomassaria siparia CBS 279.74]|uniref:SET domain-containing protein n=1 Tax=Pleomassaria siparia CBS 279.74 TaxID=1314801 RepID=A0A6G1JWS3_9PLEO|nr:SET domain-containing protein [Pleomassaria siparia CBS 279.74]
MFFTFPSSFLLYFVSTALASACNVPIPHGIPSWQSQNFSCAGPADIYVVRQSPGKGLGVFTTRTLEVGTFVMQEPPIILIHPPEFRDGVGYPLSGIGQQVRNAFNALSEAEQAEVLGLTAYYTASEKKALDDVDELLPIFRSNAYNSGNQIGLYPKIARINHDCRPNTSYFWSARLGKLVVYASRRISEGEELSTSYIPLLHTHEDRRKRLRQYGFECSCNACALGEEERKMSDQRRTDIRQAFFDLNPHLTLSVPQSKAGKQRAQDRAIASTHLVQIVQEEELMDHYAQAFRVAAICHARVEDWQSATQYAHESYQRYLMADAQSEETMEMQVLTGQFIENWNEDLRAKSMRKS